MKYYKLQGKEAAVITEKSIELCRAVPLLFELQDGTKVIDLISYLTLKKLKVVDFGNRVQFETKELKFK